MITFHFIVVNGDSAKMLASYQHFVSEIYKKSEDMLTKMYQNPKNQLKDIEKWISEKRTEKRIMEEQQCIAGFKKDFLNYSTTIREQSETEHEKVITSTEQMTELEKAYKHAETDKARKVLSVLLQETFEIQKKGEAKIKSLNEELEKKKTFTEERLEEMIQMIRDKYETLSKIEAETDILKIILPDVQDYFRNITANLKSFFENHAATETSDENEASVVLMNERPVRKETDYVKVSHQKYEAGPSINVNQNKNNNLEEKQALLKNKSTYSKSDSDRESLIQNRWPKMGNGVIIEEDEIELESEGEQEEQE